MATYYFTNNQLGNDSNDGLSIENPKKSLSAVSSLSLMAGDSVLFERGSVWEEETLNVVGQGSIGNQITYGSYGIGNHPEFSGYRTVPSWINEGNGIYSFQSNDLPDYLRNVKVNGNLTGKGKFPNKGYLPITSNATTTSVTSNQLNDSINYTGAEIVSFVLPWVIDRKIITSHSGGTLTFSAMEYINKTNSGFFIQNHIGCLNDLGDWMYNTSTKTIFMYFGATNPNTVDVKVSVTDRLIILDRISGNQSVYKRIRNIKLEGSNDDSIYLRDTSNIEIDNIEINNSGGAAINTVRDFYNTTGNYIHNNNIKDCNEQGIQGDKQCINTVIEFNNVQNIGLDVGLSAVGELNSDAISAGVDLVRSENITVRNNRVINCGYIGINSHGTNGLVENNFVSGACLRREDGAGIYTNDRVERGSGVYRKNISTNCGIKDLDYIHNFSERRPITYGFYGDDSAGNLVFEDNISFNNQHGGFYFNNPRNITMTRNIGYNNGFNQIAFNGAITQFNFQDNIWYSNLGTQPYFDFISNSDQSFLMWIESNSGTFSEFGTMDNNYFFNGNNINQAVRTTVNFGNYNSRSLEQWKAISGLETNSISRPVSELEESTLVFNDTFKAKTYQVLGSAVDQDNVAIPSEFTLQPFTYKLMLGTAVATEIGSNPVGVIRRKLKVNLV
ncbi:right-handed parallel beta-helix repeat-containing protein [Belliella pelovolcani]|uniref:right-handed parallel beta-helix repeat-containing protein n=1 Tax=Belliella pelovolcani TaxID=529505 RepID=UPI00391A1CF8